ncbi:GTP cyclohydrolase I [Nakamurella panacisegetis]|uniref:GTP cyclohydrolase 1 n=1 Tax=Nakamurella panacisegetis TaxID=1090615 RepID=A0A1H0RL05_9ACTN|nr:GTP cyclohydrolase I FolE [Nakamurella panacisegetis]SDP29628.1 GTP cyclohydrolase I [Nakamurella panacisegetis]
MTSAQLDVAATGGGRRVPLRVVHPPAHVDLAAAERAATDFLTALGVDLATEGRRDTARRMAQAYSELFRPRPFDLTTFPNDENYDELVVVRDVPVHSVCEHHVLPFVGVAHLAYLPGAHILGLSKLARVVELFARRPQVQERLTQQVADWLFVNLNPRGVGVIIEAEHLCMTIRGVQAAGTRTTTSALRGQLREDAASRAEFFALAVPRPSSGGRHG